VSIVDILPAEMQQRLKSGVCISCGQPFTDGNVHSDAGWRETQISGMCEDCFDTLLEEEEDSDE
jgi:hypothetical protein